MDTPALVRAPHPPRDFDIDVLRSLVAVAELGGLAQAGRRRGRTMAALSVQMRKLEEQAGVDLFFKDGRRLALTESGEVVLRYARRILALNDEAQLALHRSAVSGQVRVGTSQDFGEAWLPPLLARFRQQHPAVGLEVCIDLSSRLVRAVDEGEVDLALTLDAGERPNTLCVGHLPLVWIAHRDFAWDRAQPLPLALFHAPCRFRDKAAARLDEAGIPWQVALVSSSLYGIWTAVNAKLGVTLRTPQGLQPDMEIVNGKFGLPDLGYVDVSLSLSSSASARTPAVAGLAQLLRQALQARIGELEAGLAPR